MRLTSFQIGSKYRNARARDLDINISHYISHIDIANVGYGYSVPAEVQVVGGYPDAFSSW